MVFALVANDCDLAVDVFIKRENAQRALGDVLWDEPDFDGLLSIHAVICATDERSLN